MIKFPGKGIEGLEADVDSGAIASPGVHARVASGVNNVTTQVEDLMEGMDK